jgi:Tfp pilus assembly protein PilF
MPAAELKNTSRPQPASAETLEAFELSLRARARLNEITRESVQSARELLERAVARDPNFLPAYPDLHGVINQFLTHPWTPEFNSMDTVRALLELAGKAVSIDPTHPLARAIYAESLTLVGQHGTAVAQIDAVVSHHTTDIDLLRLAATVVGRSGDFERSVTLLKRGLKLDPVIVLPYWAEPLASQLYYQGNYAESAEVAAPCARRSSAQPYCRLWFAAALAQQGKLEEARRESADIVRHFPEVTVRQTVVRAGIGYRETEHARHFGEGLRKAGLPD